MIFAIDFDGTCVEHEFPKVGPDVPGAVGVLRELSAAGHQLILWTVRDIKHQQDAEHWFLDRKISLWAVNKNPEQLPWSRSRKAYAHYYIDDLALGCPLVHRPGEDRPFVDWVRMRELLVKAGALS